MSAFSPEEYQAHLTIATEGLAVQQVEIVEIQQREHVRALVEQVIPITLAAWTSQTDLHAQFEANLPYLRRSAPAIAERLELASKKVSAATVLGQPIEAGIDEIFQIDDEEVRMRLGIFRKHLARLFEKE